MGKNITLLLLCTDYTCLLFLLGFSGLLINRRNLLLMLLSLEFTFLASALNFIISNTILNLFFGSIYGIFIILVVVADTAIGVRPLVTVLDVGVTHLYYVFFKIVNQPTYSTQKR